MASKSSKQHPYAAIEHRVMDSPAFADLSHSACRVLLLIARQLTVNVNWTNGNNGHLGATFSVFNKYGIGSEHTLRDAIAELISHGFIYRSRSHGANKAWARYAVTWLPVKESKGLFMDGFVSCAWRNWLPKNKKSSRQKVQEQPGNKCSFTTENPAESAGNPPAETADYELVPIVGVSDTTIANLKTNQLVPISNRLRQKVGSGISNQKLRIGDSLP
jgi:hypothetical protein